MAFNGSLEIIKLLLEKGATVNTEDKRGVTPLLMAAQEGHIDIVTVLLANGATVNTAKENDVSPLYIAAQNGHRTIVKFLLTQDASIDAIGITGHTPLMVACLAKDNTGTNERLFKILLKRGASLSMKNNDGETAEDIAIKNNNQAFLNVIEKLSPNLCSNIKESISNIF